MCTCSDAEKQGSADFVIFYLALRNEAGSWQILGSACYTMYISITMPRKLDLKIPLSQRTRNAKRLLALRKSMNLSQSDLAKYFGVTTGAVMLWEKGDRELLGPALKLLELFEKMARGDKIEFSIEAEK